MSLLEKYLNYFEHLPTAELQHLIHSYWVFEYSSKAKDIFRHVIIPDGFPSLVYITHPYGKGLQILGPLTSQYEIHIAPGSYFVGIRFVPGILGKLFGFNIHEIKNQNVSADGFIKNKNILNLSSCIAQNFNDFSLLDKTFSENLSHTGIKVDRSVQLALETIIRFNGKKKISDIAEFCHSSLRQIQRKFKYNTGLTLKEFSRLCRLRSILYEVIINEKKFTEAIYNSGYADQQHFNKDFSAFVSFNPTLFRKLYSQIEHGNILI